MSTPDPTAALRIRPATLADEAFIREVMPRLVEFGPPAWREAAQLTATDVAVLLDAVQQPSARRGVFIAERKQPLGLVHLTVNTDFYQGEHAHLADLVVATAAEGQGVGRALLDFAESWARSQGYGWLTLSVFAQNAHARAVYERAGFGQDIVKYVKVLG